MENTMTISPKSFATSFGLGTALKFAAITIGILMFSQWASEQTGLDGQKKAFALILLIVLYFFYAISKGNAFEATARQKKKMQLLESEKQVLYEKEQALSLDMQLLQKEKQTLVQNMQSLNADFISASDRCVALSESLESEKANAKRRLEEVKAIAENEATEALLPYIQAKKQAENRANKAEMQYRLITDAIGHKRRSLSASARVGGLGSDEAGKANAKVESKEYADLHDKLLLEHEFLYEVFKGKLE
jgi:hypothetical protein